MQKRTSSDLDITVSWFQEWFTVERLPSTITDSVERFQERFTAERLPKYNHRFTVERFSKAVGLHQDDIQTSESVYWKCLLVATDGSSGESGLTSWLEIDLEVPTTFKEADDYHVLIREHVPFSSTSLKSRERLTPHLRRSMSNGCPRWIGARRNQAPGTPTTEARWKD